jgi:hypothetical protein
VQVLRLLTVVNRSLQLDDDGIGRVGFATCGHRDRQDGEHGIRREKELLLPLQFMRRIIIDSAAAIFIVIIINIIINFLSSLSIHSRV